MDFKLITPNNFGILEATLSKAHIQLLYNYIKETALPGYEFEGNTVTAHSKDNQWTLVDKDNAFEKEVFGAPTFIVNNKIFWGQDRLEYALEELN